MRRAKRSCPKSPQVLGLVVALWLLALPLAAQEIAIPEGRSDPQKGGEAIGRMMFYNVENLFDTIDDPLTDDDHFTPQGNYHWTEQRYRKKLDHLAWVISNIGEWSYPAIVGLVEVENSQVVSDLIDHPSLRRVKYDYAITTSADPRGIDVALLWDRQRLKFSAACEIPHYGTTLHFPLGKDPRSRDEAQGTGRNSLWVTLEHRATGQRLEIFVMHNPSRRGGVRSTSVKRQAVNAKVRSVIDQLLEAEPAPCVVVMGDFNDNPSDPSLRRALAAGEIEANTKIRAKRLYNLAYPLYNRGEGTHRFEGKAWLPDQIIVSGTLFLGQLPLLRERGLHIFRPSVLFTPDGKQLFRTYRGPHYSGGYSDHLPVYIDLH